MLAPYTLSLPPGTPSARRDSAAHGRALCEQSRTAASYQCPVEGCWVEGGHPAWGGQMQELRWPTPPIG